MGRYRKKPVEVEARRLTEGEISSVEDWINQEGGRARHSCSCSECQRTGKTELWIETLEGRMTARLGDFIVKGVQSEFYPCKPDIFEATYEPVGEVRADG